jgi:ferric-dicitrate binding protein FerR (iron transport regulator)
MERTRSMTAYAEELGEPDPEMTARLRARFERFIEEGGADRGRSRMWWLAAACAVFLLAAGAALGAWFGSDSGGGVVTAEEEPQRLQLAAGSVVLDAGARVRVLHDEGRSVVELVEGAVDVDATLSALAVEVISGPYSVGAVGARFRVRSTGDVPVVLVREGEAVMRGAQLPEHGVRFTPPAPAP